MERFDKMVGILRDRNGAEMRFDAPTREGESYMEWTLSERDGITACYISGVCKDGFDGNAALILRPEIGRRQVEYTAIQKHSPFWCRPLFGNDLAELPTEKKPAQGLLIREDGRWRYYLPVCDDTYKTVIYGYEDGFELRTYSNCDHLIACERQLAFVYGEGDDPFALTKRCASAVADLLGNGLRMREERRLPEVFEYLGWCSWDAFHCHVTHDKLVSKVKEFKDKGVPVRFAILDDMWGDCPLLATVPEGATVHDMIHTMHASPMRSFEGDPVRFPAGMKGAIEAMKAEGMPYVGVWFPTTGYWNGFDPEGEASEWLDLLTESAGDGLSNSDAGKLIVAPDSEKAFALFDMLCSRVRGWGGDFVKIDNQGFIEKNYKNKKPIGKVARALQTAIDSTVGSNFDGALINCMGMPSECMFNRRSSAVSRCSDDFQPENREWFAKNILQCSYNGLLQGQYYVNDWDMFWTDDEQAKKNSLCRAVSGGPIYVSDRLGCTDPAILLPLALSDGRILRPDESATPTADCLIGNPTESGRIFKIRNRVGKNGLVAAFNIDAENRSVSGEISPADACLPTGKYAYYEYFTGEAGILAEGETLTLSLSDNDEFRLVTLVPYEDGKPAALGRLDKFIGIGAVVDATGRGCTLLEGGKLGFISEKPIGVETEEHTLCAERRGVLSVVETAADETHLFYTDPVTA